MNSVNEVKITYRNEIMYRAVNRLSSRGGKRGRECIRHTRHFPQVIGLEVISEFTQQDSRKKRTAKRLCVTHVTGLLLACFVFIFT